MKTLKIFIVTLFTLAAFLNIQAQSPKLVWTNLQEKYERFEDVKPVLKNISDQPVYFDCSNVGYGSFPNYSYTTRFKLLLNNVEDHWDWNVFYCGFETRAARKAREKKEKTIAKLKKQGKYIPEGCKLEPGQEYPVRFSNELWKYIRFGEGSAFYDYSSGRYKFTLEYDWANAQNPVVAESPAFVVALKEE